MFAFTSPAGTDEMAAPVAERDTEVLKDSGYVGLGARGLG
jgi:hypothetical protein